jgi:hypothetical protein
MGAKPCNEALEPPAGTSAVASRERESETEPAASIALREQQQSRDAAGRLLVFVLSGRLLSKGRRSLFGQWKHRG